MYWTIGQFPELDHLDASQRAEVLARVPWWTYPLIVVRAAAAGLLAGGSMCIAGLVALEPPAAVLVAAFCLIAVPVTLGVYQHQLRRLRAALRQSVADGFRGRRPPFCFHCGYDLRGSAAETCPECGREVAVGPASNVW